MRIIDADKIPYFPKKVVGEGTYNIVTQSYIESMHIVEAIPTEWIQKKLIDYVCSGKYSSSDLPIVYALISEWRKENDIE